ncbi:MAG TPA: nucleotidyltransferase domain-containing protein [Rhodothermales bacterium]|nr:nucleotidyltransferase domain-containing protein [Rhodothermales bacterium]
MKLELQQALDEARARLRALYGDRLRRVILYGSQARGDAGPESDVDVLVVLEGPLDVYAETKQLSRLSVELMDQYGFFFAFMPYEKSTFQYRPSSFISVVREEGMEL